MKDPKFDSIQEWIRQETKYFTVSDFIARRRQLSVNYNGALAAPEYFAAFDYAPVNIAVLNPPQASGERPVVDITVSMMLSKDDTANVNTVGIVAAALGYSPSLPIDANSVTSDKQTSLPSIDTVCGFNPYEGLVAYDPTSLPIAGANFPIFTRASTDPLTARNIPIYWARSGLFGVPPAVRDDKFLWAGAVIQINGNATTADAGTITFQWSWSAPQ